MLKGFKRFNAFLAVYPPSYPESLQILHEGQWQNLSIQFLGVMRIKFNKVFNSQIDKSHEPSNHFFVAYEARSLLLRFPCQGGLCVCVCV